ncbi:N(2)-fixation sustaining protein CowN [Azonexus sp.]|uniref:N(2)-fixation sustaining protein CowN n=1 Tax=Azonexus sp. TaxID=1872668 RepID=UPI0035B0C638
MARNREGGAECSCRKGGDRYVSFDGIDCDGNARRLIEFILRNVAAQGGEQPFWHYFLAKRTPKSGPPPDDLFLIHAHINQIRDFFAACGDEEAMALLVQVEEECC